MSERRKVGELVLIDNGEDDPFLARIVVHGAGTEPDDCVLDCSDPNCGEWPVVHVVRANGSETGERVFHVSECEMATPGHK